MSDRLRIGYIGNFDPEHSTENHVRQAIERVGHQCLPFQENQTETWTDLGAYDIDLDLVLWTRTGWDWPHLTGWSWEEATGRQRDLLAHLAGKSIPTVGFHLDRWWGLDREGQVDVEPFFRCDLVCTADGGHPDKWEQAGVNHVWLPPGVSLAECERTPRIRAEYARTPLVWVGSWQHYHPEWQPYRRELIGQLRSRYRGKVGLYPKRGRGIRGQPLCDLYNSAKIVIGDSCLAGGATRYWSDRIPETVGRGGFLVHPWVDGLDEHFGPEHLATWPLGDWDALFAVVDHYLSDDGARDTIRRAGREHVMNHHTYERRVEQVIDLCEEQGLL